MKPSRFPQFPAPFGRYSVLRQLGKGGMGEVYLARDTSLDRKVALKIPHIEPGQEKRLLGRFLREAKLAASLDHPGLVRVFDVGEVDGTHYLSMAYIKGKSLQSVLAANGKLSPKQACSLVKRLALALDQAHKAGVTHRDLKPSNIMIGADSRPIIVDFGLARPDALLDSQFDEGQEFTRDGQLVGTLWYMSPEQVRGKTNSVGPPSDIFSLGVILYETLAGQLPFNGSMGDVLGQITHQEPQSLTELGIDKQLNAICMQAIAKPQEKRFASMKRFAVALDNWQKHTQSKVQQGAVTASVTATTTPEPQPVPTQESPVFVAPSSPRRQPKRSNPNKIIFMSWFVNLAMMGGMILALYLAKDYIAALVQPKQIVVQQPTPQPKATPAAQPRQVRPKSQASSTSTSQDSDNRTERRWQAVLRALPKRISLDTNPVALSIGSVPNREIPWQMEIDDEFVDLGDAASLAVVKHNSKPKWSVCVQPAGASAIPLAEFDITGGKLAIQTVSAPQTKVTAEDLQLTTISISHHGVMQRIEIRPSAPSALQIDLNQQANTLPLLPNVTTADRLQMRLTKIRINKTAWNSQLQKSAHWKAGASHWNETVQNVQATVLPQLEAESVRQELRLGEDTSIELSGPVAIRLTLRWGAKDSGVTLTSQVEHRDGARWRRFQPAKDGPKFLDALQTYDRSYRELNECAANMKVATKRIATLQTGLASIPANTVSQSDIESRNRMAALLSAANTAVGKLKGRGRRLTNTLRRQQPTINELGYLHAVATLLHKHASIEYQLYATSDENGEVVFVESENKAFPRVPFSELR